MLLEGLASNEKHGLRLCVGLIGLFGLRPSELGELTVDDGKLYVGQTKRNMQTLHKPKGPPRRIITMDLHTTQIQGFAKIPFDNLYSRTVLFETIKSQGFDPETSVVLAPDIGSAKMSQSYAKHMSMHFALIDKRRYAPNKAEVNHLIGDLENMDVLIMKPLKAFPEQNHDAHIATHLSYMTSMIVKANPAALQILQTHITI